MLKESGKKLSIIGLCLLLLAAGACQGRNPEQPIMTPTPTAEPEAVLPTDRPEPTAGAEPTKKPSETPKPTPPPELRVTPEPTKTQEPSEAPEPSATPEPTKAQEPSQAPEPSATPEPIREQEPSQAPEPTKIPEPDPLTLVGQGWQSMLDITMRYYVVFPDCFTHCTVSRTEDRDSFVYTSEAYPELTLTISYVLGQTYEDAIEQIGQLDGLWLEQEKEEKRAAYRVDGVTKTCGRLLENTFETWLLYGSSAGEEETAGILWVELSYPQSQEELFESEPFRFFFRKLESGTD